MEYLIFAVILYFILQTAGNLVYILRGGSPEPSSSPTGPTHNWEGPSPRRHTEGLTDHPTFWGDDVEDARWQDLAD
jgi:hypothetical protein